VDLAHFRAARAEGQRTPRTLLFISRISSRKGVREIVELSHRLDDLSGSVRLLVIGGYTQWSDYRAHLSGLNPRVADYLGVVASEDMPALMHSAAMLLVPSRYEPGSIVTGEALACGLPVVLSDEVGPAEVVAGPHVRVHRAGDVDSLETAVRSLLDAVENDEPSLRVAARANAEQRFAVRAAIAQLIEMISALGAGGDATGLVPATSAAQERRVTRINGNGDGQLRAEDWQPSR
jgi:glycosyltransferase involved in cell wall biosynthesis